MTAAPAMGVRFLRSMLGVMGKAKGGGPPTVRGFLNNPLAAAGLALPTAAFASSYVGAPLVKGVYDAINPDDYLDETRAQLGNYTEDLLYKLQDARKKEEIQRNMMAVQRSDPHLYAQVMAGRRLPQGSVVLGGQPRQDLMEELASYMGSLPDPDPVFQ